ncbi:MAG: hypothetical protein IKI39_03250 [Oscillospiraceae bacterium]|nr:hypothetical protein [Oscillospiraceae bacterium]
MKKIIAMLLVFVMLFALSATAMADGEGAGIQTMSFITAWRAVLSNKLNGDFVKVGPLELDVWVPDILNAQTDMPDDTYLLYKDSTGNMTMQVHHVNLDGAASLEEVEKHIVDAGGVSDGILWVNDLNVLVYEDKSSDSINGVILISDDNTGVEFVFTGVSNEEIHSLASIIMSTVQRHTLDTEDVALMIDADLNNTWGECRHVTYAEDGSHITVNMWDANVTADNIKSVNNWDTFKQDKLDDYNLYAEILQRFHMDDVTLTLNVTDPNEETVFLAIENGEFTTDISAQ